MFIMLTVASLCAVYLIGSLLRLICRHRPEMWIAGDDTIMCFVAPVTIALLTFGGISLGWRLTHGGLSEVSWDGWVESGLLIAATAALYVTLAAWIRKRPAAPAVTPVASATETPV